MVFKEGSTEVLFFAKIDELIAQSDAIIRECNSMKREREGCLMKFSDKHVVDNVHEMEKTKYGH